MLAALTVLLALAVIALVVTLAYRFSIPNTVGDEYPTGCIRDCSPK